MVDERAVCGRQPDLSVSDAWPFSEGPNGVTAPPPDLELFYMLTYQSSESVLMYLFW